MMEFDYDYFSFGITAANLCKSGIIHTDLRKDSIVGTKLVDYGGIVKVFKYPNDLLDKSVFDLLLVSLKSSIRELSQKQRAWFRLGYICAGGILSKKLFDNLFVETNLSSFVLDDTGFCSTITPQKLNEDDVKRLLEWKKIDLKQLNEIPPHHYGRYKVRKKVDMSNLYYLDLFYFILLYEGCCMEYENANMDRILVYFNLGNLEHAFCHLSSSYGFLKIALQSCKDAKDVEMGTYISLQIQESLSEIASIPCYKQELIAGILSQKEKSFAELVWKLYDIEHSCEPNITSGINP